MAVATVLTSPASEKVGKDALGQADALSQKNKEAERLHSLSYSEQYDELVAKPIEQVDFMRPFPKPSKAAQDALPEARGLPYSDVRYITKRKYFWQNSWLTEGFATAVFMILIHAACLLVPYTYSWQLAVLWCFVATLGGFSIEMTYHRQLCHRSFKTPKWFEYSMSYVGMMQNMGSPLDWVSDHRYHHLHTDTPLDPHSSYEGFWWSHIGWLFDDGALWPKNAFENATDMSDQWWYRFTDSTYWLHLLAHIGMLYYFGGLPAVVWLFALKVVVVFHLTFLVNSAAHIWGSQPYATNDLSTNSLVIAILTLGEWHNNHHAFEHSARVGLEWWEFDASWYFICVLKALGIATNVKVPTQREKDRLRNRKIEQIAASKKQT